MQWREHPGPDGGEADYRVYLGYWFSLYATPLARCGATMSVSLQKVLRRLRRFSAGRKLLDMIPEKVMKRLEAASIDGRIEIEGGGSHDIRVDEPGHAIPSIGTDEPGASKVEFDGSVVWKGSGSIDFDSLVSGEDGGSLGSITVSLSAEMKVTMGIIVDIEGRRLGAYVEGDFEGVDLSVTIDLPTDLADYEFKSDKIGASHIDRRTLDFAL